MNIVELMRRDWDARARKDAFFYIASWRPAWDEAAFFESGEEDYRRFVEGTLAARSFSVAGKSMLELGCGAGRMTRSFARRFARVSAFDISSEMLQRARALNPEAGNIQWVLGNGTDLSPIPANAVDFVFSYLVLQHLPQEDLVRKYISEMLRVLSDGGLCVFQFNGTMRKNMNWRGRMAWGLMDGLWSLRLHGMATAVAHAFHLDPEMAGKNWHGPALKASQIIEAVLAAGGEAVAVSGEDTPMAWCCVSKHTGKSAISNA